MAVPKNLLAAIEELADHGYNVALRYRTLQRHKPPHWSIDVGEPNLVDSYGHGKLRELIELGERHGIEITALGPSLSLRLGLRPVDAQPQGARRRTQRSRPNGS